MATTATASEIQEKLFEELAQMADGSKSVSREATFEELDIDSLDLVELAQVVEDEFGVLLEAEDVKDLKNVGEAIDLVVARTS